MLQEDGVQLKNYHENGEWTLQETWNNRTEYTDDAYTYAKVGGGREAGGIAMGGSTV